MDQLAEGSIIQKTVLFNCGKLKIKEGGDKKKEGEVQVLPPQFVCCGKPTRASLSRLLADGISNALRIHYGTRSVDQHCVKATPGIQLIFVVQFLQAHPSMTIDTR